MQSASYDGWLWDAGDYAVTAGDLHGLSEEAVRRAAPRPGEDVLDLGTGTGNAALLAAGAGAATTGVDLADRLLAQARERSLEADVPARFVHGDLHDLPFPDDAFDVALSVSACVLVPDPERTAGELVRVLRPGGRAVLVGWHEDSILGRLNAWFPVVGDELLSADPGWYAPDRVERLFAPLAASVATEELPFAIAAEDVGALARRMTTTHPVMVAARTRYDETAWRAIVAQLEGVLQDHVRERPDHGVELPMRALVMEVTADA